MAERNAHQQHEDQLRGGADSAGIGRYLMHRAKPHLPPRGSASPVPDWREPSDTCGGPTAPGPESA